MLELCKVFYGSYLFIIFLISTNGQRSIVVFLEFIRKTAILFSFKEERIVSTNQTNQIRTIHCCCMANYYCKRRHISFYFHVFLHTPSQCLYSKPLSLEQFVGVCYTKLDPLTRRLCCKMELIFRKKIKKGVLFSLTFDPDICRNCFFSVAVSVRF